MTRMRTASEVAEHWKEATARAGRRYMAEQTPQERLHAARESYVRGHIDHAAFELSAELAIRHGA